MFKIKKVSAVLFVIACLCITACTWVKLSPGAEEVRVFSRDEIVNCQKKGQSTVSLKASIVGIKRSKKKVQQELNTLGKNSAVNIGGNVIVPASEVEHGKQTFDVYSCQ